MGNQKILVVDDNEEIRNILHILLESEGYIIIEAPDGETALTLVDDTIDLVILDIMMPGISGLDVCKKIRETYQMPILFLTAKGTDSDKSLGLLIGADDYLSKPIDKLLLEEILNRHLKNTSVAEISTEEQKQVEESVKTDIEEEIELI